MSQEIDLRTTQRLIIQQRFEIAEFIGIESRNKFEIGDQDGRPIAYAAEQGKGILGFLLRMFLGHWRTFEIHFFNLDRQLFMRALHPFRWYFQRLEIFDATGRFIGALQKQFAILNKLFVVEDANGRILLTMTSPIWRIWTFPFTRAGKQVACIRKKWGGLLTEGLTDKDRFAVEYDDPSLSAEERQLILAAALFVDLQYFERKARS